MRNKHNVELRQWAVVKVRFRPTDRDEHPAVIVSNDEHCADTRLTRINVLYGTKTSPGNPPRLHQALLNSAEGLDFLTAIDCSYFYTIDKDAIAASLGNVSLERRRALKRTIVASYRLL
jgi:PemK-like, MazF-like toxin of type II toxin-antitoxin system